MVSVVSQWQVWAGWLGDESMLQRMLAHWRYILKTHNIYDWDVIKLDEQCPEETDLAFNYNTHDSLDACMQLKEQENSNLKFAIIAAPTELPQTIQATELSNYVHPIDNVCYIVGADYGSFNWAELENYNIDVIYIDVPGPNDTGLMMSHQALAVTLYDRHKKLG